MCQKDGAMTAMFGRGHDCHVWQVSIHGAYMYAYLSRMHHFFCFFLVCAGLGPSLEGKHAWCIHVYVCIPIKHKPFFVFPPCMRGTGCRLTRQGAGYLHPVYLFITGMRGTGWRRTRCSIIGLFCHYNRSLLLLQACAGLGEDARVVQGDGYSQGTQDGVWVKILESQRPAIFDVYSHYRADFWELVNSCVRTKRILASLRVSDFIFDKAVDLLLDEVAPPMFVCMS